MAAGPLLMTCVLCQSNLIQSLALAIMCLRRHAAARCGQRRDALSNLTELQKQKQLCLSRPRRVCRYSIVVRLCWLTNWIITGPLCVTSDSAFAHYKVDLTSRTFSTQRSYLQARSSPWPVAQWHWRSNEVWIRRSYRHLPQLSQVWHTRVFARRNVFYVNLHLYSTRNIWANNF